MSKLIKATGLGITTSLDGVLYNIGQEAILVSDEVASKLREQFLHTIEVSDVQVEAPAETSPEETTTVESPKKSKRSKKE